MRKPDDIFLRYYFQCSEPSQRRLTLVLPSRKPSLALRAAALRIAASRLHICLAVTKASLWVQEAMQLPEEQKQKQAKRQRLVHALRQNLAKRKKREQDQNQTGTPQDDRAIKTREKHSEFDRDA
ncbi:MAG: hypothetical protein ACKVON_01890 [Beijerinckiaceae bacterium]